MDHVALGYYFDSDLPADPVKYGRVTISNFTMEGGQDTGKAIRVSPGATISCQCDYAYSFPSEKTTINQIIVGFQPGGAKVAIYNKIGDGSGHARFQLTAPSAPGLYVVRFRYAQAYTAANAVKYWWDVDNKPTWDASIGLVSVS